MSQNSIYHAIKTKYNFVAESNENPASTAVSPLPPTHLFDQAGYRPVKGSQRIDIDVTANSGCNIYLDENNPYVKIVPIGETGSFTTYWNATKTYLRIYRWENSGDNSYDETATIDNVVVREVTGGNHGRMVNMHPEDFTGDTA